MVLEAIQAVTDERAEKLEESDDVSAEARSTLPEPLLVARIGSTGVLSEVRQTASGVADQVSAARDIEIAYY